jgi:hypothetical protein
MKKILGLAGLVTFAATTTANAALTAPTIATADFEAIAGSVLAAAAVFWGIRKAINLVG